MWETRYYALCFTVGFCVTVYFLFEFFSQLRKKEKSKLLCIFNGISSFICIWGSADLYFELLRCLGVN